MSKMIELRFYGPLAGAIARDLRFVPEQPLTNIAGLRAALGLHYPDLGELLSCGRSRCVIGDQFVAEDHVLSGDEIVEFFPPVSGG